MHFFVVEYRVKLYFIGISREFIYGPIHLKLDIFSLFENKKVAHN